MLDGDGTQSAHLPVMQASQAAHKRLKHGQQELFIMLIMGQADPQGKLYKPFKPGPLGAFPFLADKNLSLTYPRRKNRQLRARSVHHQREELRYRRFSQLVRRSCFG